MTVETSICFFPWIFHSYGTDDRDRSSFQVQALGLDVSFATSTRRAFLVNAPDRPQSDGVVKTSPFRGLEDKRILSQLGSIWSIIRNQDGMYVA